MEKYINMVGRLFDIRLKGSTTRLASAVLIVIGIGRVFSGDYMEGATVWAIGAGLWGLRDAIK